jgi:hypothetical protein
MIQIQGPAIRENRWKGSNQGSHEITIVPGTPVTRKQAQDGLRTLMDRLTPAERKALGEAIAHASQFIEQTAASGGIQGNAYRSFPVSDNSGNRVDMLISGDINLIKD